MRLNKTVVVAVATMVMAAGCGMTLAGVEKQVAAFNAATASDVSAVADVVRECGAGEARVAVLSTAVPAVVQLLTTAPTAIDAWVDLARRLVREYGAGVLRCALAHVPRPAGELGARGQLQPDGTYLHRAAVTPSAYDVRRAADFLRTAPTIWLR